jgi:hypothetical protein
MIHRKLELNLYMLLGGENAAIIGPIKLGAYLHHLPATLTSQNMNEPFQIPHELRTGLPRRVYWVEGERFLDDNLTYQEQQLTDGDTIVLTDVVDELILLAAGMQMAEHNRTMARREMIDDVSLGVATRLREDLAKSGHARPQIESGFLFIVMAMSPDDPTLVDVHHVIIEVATKEGLNAVRVDDIQTNERITDRILNYLDKAEFVVADLTHSRPNVFFEAGYAHGIGKIPIYVARAGTTIEFDIKDYPVIFFKNLTELRERLSNRLKTLVESAKLHNQGQEEDQIH